MRIVLKEGMKSKIVLDQMSHCVSGCAAPGLRHGQFSILSRQFKKIDLKKMYS